MAHHRTLPTAASALAAGLGLVLVLGGCDAAPRPSAASGAASTVPSPAAAASIAAPADADLFPGCSAFTARMRELAAPGVTAYGGDHAPPPPTEFKRDAPGVGPLDDLAGPEEDVANGPSYPAGDGRSVPDTVATDGDVVLALLNGDGALRVIDSTGDAPAQRARLRFPQGEFPAGMLVLGGHRVLVLGTTYGEPTGARTGRAEKVVLTLLDVATPARPQVLRKEKITGRYLGARLDGGIVRVALSTPPRLRYSSPADGEPASAALARNRAMLDRSAASDWLPLREIVHASGLADPAGPAVPCTQVRAPARPSGVGLLSVVSLDTRGGADAFDGMRGTAVVGSGELAALSADRVLLATTAGGWEPAGAAEEAVPPRTEIYAYDATGAGASYLGTAEVAGYLPGRWAMSARGGHVRAITTAARPWPVPGGFPGSPGAVRTAPGDLVVLAERAGRLDPVASIGDIGRGTAVRAVRWIGELAAVVTVGQGDPVRLVDLSAPGAAHPVGTLDVAGYTAYLRPLPDHRMLAVAADGASRQSATVFDLADPAAPRRTGTVPLAGRNGTYPLARTLIYLPGRGVAYLPAFLTTTLRCPPTEHCLSPAEPDAIPSPTAAPADPLWTPGPLPAPQRAPRREGQPVDVPGEIALAIGAEGAVTEVARWIGPEHGARIVEIDGGRLLAVGDGSATVLDDRLRELGSATLPG